VQVITGHGPDCLFIRDGGRSQCTCWPETQRERAALKETTLNEIGAALGRVEGLLTIPDGLFSYRQRIEKRLEFIESKLDAQGEALDADFSTHATNSIAQYNELRATLNVICEHQLKIEERFKAGHEELRTKIWQLSESLDIIIRTLIDRKPEPRVKPVRRTTKKGKRR
jgi:hypothetical protein